ncbi:MAG: hypothetical protein WDN44_12090 [Sphingomonas sp.]
MSIWQRTRVLRWWIIALVMLGTIVNYLTRSTLAVAAPTFMADLHIDERQYSYITAWFQGGIMLQPMSDSSSTRSGCETGWRSSPQPGGC